MKILVTGATGYVGGRLVPRLLKKGYQVRATSRNLLKLTGRYWAQDPNVEIVPSDALDSESLLKAVEGCDAAYYLIHSMVQEGKQFEKTDQEAASNFLAASESAGLKRIIYLGGLGNEQDQLSRHLQSRREVGEIFQKGKIPITILQAAMIIGAGSASFEILRYLVEYLPIMVTPKWVRTEVQPIAIVNVLNYLVGVLEKRETAGQNYDIGGPEITTYQKLMDTYAQVIGLKKRVVIRVNFLSPWLSSHWIGLVTPLPSSLGKPLVEGLSNRVICQENRIREIIPQTLLTAREAMQKAIELTYYDKVETSWHDAGIIPPAEWVDRGDPDWAGGTHFENKRTLIIEQPLEKVWQTILKVGGKTGWYSPMWLWKVRGWIDKRMGGVGLTRGRRSVSHLQVGDSVDFWRVCDLEPQKRLLLVAEMKLPGKAALEFRLQEKSADRTELTLLARFLPRALMGRCYWYVLVPFHRWIFNSILKQIAKD
ncbi:MAG: SDR family oxidoreductase [Chlamydiales bacterium]